MMGRSGLDQRRLALARQQDIFCKDVGLAVPIEKGCDAAIVDVDM
jgi:hypothetical protein